ncbi:hypothetical protein WEB32_02725 [Streptomyces netropsis]|uniref:Secreted protein n=1 Tax=Streptomyces netropsis TaxID=55404 RepID=A0A7W7PFQ8_STRNE|nr:hypothetical protein [Streptomyces netropsis]MBB4889116.1 hypothetical protein [Streptomyces netropsis]GGR07884.1 hypothetical protein GCM10010219_10050 [Streptomyces netropsis]
MAVSRSWMCAVVLAALTSLGTTVPATASSSGEPFVHVQCHGTESVTYHPGVTFRARKVDITTDGRFGSCADSQGKVTSGSYGERFTVFAGCNDLLDGFEDRRTFTWSTGDTSVMKATGTSTAVAGQVVTTIKGTVTQGRFRGRTVVQVVTVPQPELVRCLTTGLTGATGVTTLAIT